MHVSTSFTSYCHRACANTERRSERFILSTLSVGPTRTSDVSFYGRGSVGRRRLPCCEAKQLWLGYAANAVYIQHAGLRPKPLHYNVVSEVPKTWLGPGSQISDGPLKKRITSGQKRGQSVMSDCKAHEIKEFDYSYNI